MILYVEGCPNTIFGRRWPDADYYSLLAVAFNLVVDSVESLREQSYNSWRKSILRDAFRNFNLRDGLRVNHFG